MKLMNLLNEASTRYGIKKIVQDLENYATKKDISFWKKNIFRKPGAFGSDGISFNFYSLGDKFILIKVDGSFGTSVYVTDGPDLTSKASAAVQFPDDKYEIYTMLDKINFGQGSKDNEKSQWTKAKIDKLIKDLKSERNYDDSEAWDIAEGIFLSEEGLEEAIKKIYRVSNALEWLIDRI